MLQHKEKLLNYYKKWRNRLLQLNICFDAIAFAIGRRPSVTLVHPTQAIEILYLLQRKCRPQNLVFIDLSFMAILAGVTPSESDEVRQSALASENLTNNQP